MVGSESRELICQVSGLDCSRGASRGRAEYLQVRTSTVLSAVLGIACAGVTTSMGSVI